MESATNAELIVRAIAEALRSLVFDIIPWGLLLLLLAVPLGCILVRLRKDGIGIIGLLVLNLVFTFFIAAVATVIHFFLAFGESFGNGVDDDRRKAFIIVGLAFPLVVGWATIRNEKNKN